MNDAASFAAHYAACRAGLIRYMEFAAGRDVAEDLAHEAFLRAWEAYGGFDARHSFRAWLFQIGRHLVIDAHRRQPEPSVALDAIAEPVARDEYTAIERWLDARRIWKRLTPEQQSSLRLSLLGYSDAEAAPLLGVKRVTHRRRVMRAKHALRRFMR